MKLLFQYLPNNLKQENLNGCDEALEDRSWRRAIGKTKLCLRRIQQVYPEGSRQIIRPVMFAEKMVGAYKTIAVARQIFRLFSSTVAETRWFLGIGCFFETTSRGCPLRAFVGSDRSGRGGMHGRRAGGEPRAREQSF